MTAPKKKPRGRPKGSTRPATTIVGVRLSAAQRDAIQKAADGIELSTWIREAALMACGRADLGIAGMASRMPTMAS